MEYLVLGSTTCARNSTFVWWQDGSSMFGLRFGKENQAEQVLMELFILSNFLAINSLKCSVDQNWLTTQKQKGGS